MHASLAAGATVVVAMSFGCSQVSPTGPGSVTLTQSMRPTAMAVSAPAAKEVPFTGDLEGTVTLTPLGPPFGFVLIEATGTASHLGRFTVTVPHTVNFATSTGSGSYEFVAANGDSLIATFTGQARPEGALLSIVETATITGGTGRFAGATGGFTARRLFDPVSRVTTGSFDGTISLPGNGGTH